VPSDQTTAIVAIAVSGGVALLSAVVTPLTAHWRQERALDEERERLRISLEAERARLEHAVGAERERVEIQLQNESDREQARLEHDFALHDLQELRDLLERAASAIDDVWRACSRIQTTLKLRLAGLEDEFNDLKKASEAMRALDGRLSLRFDPTGPILDAWERAQRATLGGQTLFTGTPSPEQRRRLDEMHATVLSARGDFMRAAGEMIRMHHAS
jgi:chromosome segregation ATPase